MRADEIMAIFAKTANQNIYRFEDLRDKVPVGINGTGNVVTAHPEAKHDRYNVVCVSGEEKTNYIVRLCMMLAGLYEDGEAEFLILSPKKEYGELLRLKNAYTVVPFINTEDDVKEGIQALNDLCRTNSFNGGKVRIFLILDGIEDVIAHDEITDVYKPYIDSLQRTGVEIIAGIPIEKSRYSSYPGAVIGIGNCLVMAKSKEKADITYVEADSSLGLPQEISYQSEPDVELTVDFYNRLS